MNAESKIHYPAIHAQASRSSAFYQKTSRILLLVNLCVLVAVAGVDALEPDYLNNLYPKTFLLTLSISLAIITKKLCLEKKWYAARSLSETIKTLIWRYAMGAAPFDHPNTDKHSLLLKRLEAACMESNSLIGYQKFYLNKKDPLLAGPDYDSCQPRKKLDIYIRDRFSSQLKWYLNRASYNSSMSKVFFTLFLICNFLALSCSAWQETDISVDLPFTGLLIAISTALIGWIESKKYSELSAAYSLTHDEINFFYSDIHNVSSNEDLIFFVTDAEALFSREHTQWAAKRGYIRNL